MEWTIVVLCVHRCHHWQRGVQKFFVVCLLTNRFGPIPRHFSSLLLKARDITVALAQTVVIRLYRGPLDGLFVGVFSDIAPYSHPGHLFYLVAVNIFL